MWENGRISTARSSSRIAGVRCDCKAGTTNSEFTHFVVMVAVRSFYYMATLALCYTSSKIQRGKRCCETVAILQMYTIYSYSGVTAFAFLLVGCLELQ